MSRKGILYKLLIEKYSEEKAKILAELILKRQRAIKKGKSKEEIEEITSEISEITGENKGEL